MYLIRCELNGGGVVDDVEAIAMYIIFDYEIYTLRMIIIIITTTTTTSTTITTITTTTTAASSFSSSATTTTTDTTNTALPLQRIN